MAGDWIKMRTNLDTDPAVVRISSGLNTDRFSVVGRLHKIWSWANEHLTDGQDVPIDSEFLDCLVETPGFSEQMRRVGWLSGRDGSLGFPSFDRHNGSSAKQRAMDSQRKKTVRKVSEKCPDANRTKTGPEKRREEKSINKYIETPKAARCFSDSFFDGVWAKWRKHRSEKQKPLGDIEEETQLMDLSRHGEPEAIEIVDFSIRCGAVNLITNGNHKKQQPTGSNQTSQSRSRFSLKDIPV